MRTPRFSLRTLAIVVTLVCLYFAAWEATKRYGANEVESSPMPFIVYYDEYETPFDFGIVDPIRRHYFFWMFGKKIALPSSSNDR